MTSVLHSQPPFPPFPHPHHYHHTYMQSGPFRNKMIPPRSPPMPPSLIDSPFVQSPNSPYRRDHSISPSDPQTNTNHDRLNLRDTVPQGSSKPVPHGFDPEPTPDDIGVAGTPKSARSSAIAGRSIPLRPNLARGNSWYLQQQAIQMQQLATSKSHPHPPPSSSQSTSKPAASSSSGTTSSSAARP